VAWRLEALGVDASRIEVVEGLDCVARFVQQESEGFVRRLAANLVKSYHRRLNAPLAVGWPYPGVYSSVSGYMESDDAITLHVGTFGRIQSLARPGVVLPDAYEGYTAITLGDLPLTGREDRLLYASDGQSTWLLTGCVAQLHEPEAGTTRAAYQTEEDDDWIVFRPLGRYQD
jgi:hypothetical protein